MKHMMIKVLSLVMALTMIMGMFGAVALSAAEHVHTKGDKVKTVAPTCVAYGYTLYECADCGEIYADDILAKTEECQNIVDVKEVAATCTSNAISAGKQCADCGTYSEGGEEIPGTKLEHNMVIAITQPTCDADGEVYEYCSLCNKQRQQLKNLPALGEDGEHVTEYVITKAPSCGESGLATWGCVLCDDYTVEGIYITPNPDLHEWEEIDEEPTCTAPGFKGWECTECWTTTTVDPETGVELEDGGILEAYNHKRSVTKITSSNYENYAFFINNEFKVEDLELIATCTEDGFYYVYCNDCKQIQKIVVEAYEHSFDDNFDKGTNSYKAEYVVKEVLATCEASGYVVVKCDNYAVCDCEETKTIVTKAALSSNHTHKWWSELTQQYKDTLGAKVEDDILYWGRVEATCTTGGYTWVECTNSNCASIRKFDAVDALGHNYEYRCDECGDEECIYCTHERTLVCVDNDDRDGCSATQEVTVQAEHKMSKDKDVITVPATCSRYAYDTYYCKNEDCGYIGDTLYEYAIKDDDGNVIFDEEAGYDADNHSDLKEMIITKPTCITEGKVRYSCYNCSVGTWDEAIPVLKNHDEYREDVAEVPATCTNKGWTAGVYCEKCKEEGADADGWIKGHTQTSVNSSNHEAKNATEIFHRPGTCTIVELTVYTCAKDGAKFNVEGELDAYNHNKYVYVNNVLDVAQSSSAIIDRTDLDHDGVEDTEILIGEETHWGACLEYKPAFFTCEDDGYHANVSCTSCKEVVGVSMYEYVAAVTDPADPDVVLVWAENQNTNGDDKVSGSDATCPICKNWESTSTDMDGDKQNEWEESPHATYVYVLNDDGSFVSGTQQGKVVDYKTVQLLLPATGHKLTDVTAVEETCLTDGHTAGKNCTNAWPKNIAATKDKDDTNDDACGYKEGQTFIPAHGDAYTEKYDGKAPTCSTYGIGILVTANVYQNERYEKFVVIPEVFDEETFETIYDGQAIVYVDGVYKVVEAKALENYDEDQIVVDTEGNISDGYNFKLVDDEKIAAIGGEYCTKCENKKDITNRSYYIAPLAHEYDVNVEYNGCDSFGWVEIKCANCSENGPHWLDRDGDNVVDIDVVWGDDNTIENAVELELSWFFTEFDYATGHDYPEYKKVDDVPDTGWLVLGEILSDDEVSELRSFGYENVFGAINACTTDRVKYVECPDCGERKAMGDVIPATGHYLNETDGTKTYISTACNEISKWVGYTCANCFTTITKNTVPTHELVHVYLKETCTKEGLSNCYACVNCDDHYSIIYNNDLDELDIIKIDFTPTEDEAEANDYDLEMMEAIVESIVIPKHSPTITKIDEYVPATATKDGYYVYTCRDCGETVKEVLKAVSQLIIDISIEDVNGAEVTANGNEIVVKVAYTAKEYKFRALNLDFWFDNDYLTFNKAEIKAEYDAALNVITDVAVDEDEINVLTYVPNGLKQNAALTGEGTAFIYFYFTVNIAETTIDIDDFELDYVEAKYYDAKTNTNVDQSQYVIWNDDYELDVYATGDVDAGYEIDYSDLLDMMDIIYTTDAKYNAMADINKDGVIDVEDFAALKTFVGTKQTALDYAEMMGVELPDYETIALQVLNIEKLDVNGDDKINKADLDALCNNDNYTSYYLDILVNELDSYAGWDAFFYAYVPASMTEADIVETMTEVIIVAYELMIA